MDPAAKARVEIGCVSSARWRLDRNGMVRSSSRAVSAIICAIREASASPHQRLGYQETGG